MDADIESTKDVEALRAMVWEARLRVVHLEEHCAYMAKAFASERLCEVEPKTDAEIDAHRCLLEARIAHADDQGAKLKEIAEQDQKALDALGPKKEPPPVPPETPPAASEASTAGDVSFSTGGGKEARKAAPRARRARAPADRRVQRKESLSCWLESTRAPSLCPSYWT